MTLNYCHTISVSLCVCVSYTYLLMFHHFSAHRKLPVAACESLCLRAFFFSHFWNMFCPRVSLEESIPPTSSPQLIPIGNWCTNAPDILSFRGDNSGTHLRVRDIPTTVKL